MTSEGSATHTKSPWLLVEVAVLALLLASLFGGAALTAVLSSNGAPRRAATEGPVVPFAQPVEVDESFPRDGLEIGFADSDTDGTWVISSLANLRFQVMGDSSPSNIALAVYPFTPEAFPRREIQIATSRGSSSFDLSGGGQIVQVELDGLSKQLITIRCRLVGSPVELALGDDVRPLCLKLIWFQVT